MTEREQITIRVDASITVSGLLQIPPEASACFVFAHGAGAGMTHPIMGAVADALFAHGVATLRYLFPFMQAGSRRPDRPALAHATVRAAVAAASARVPTPKLFAGGKSFGARMTSQAQAEEPLPGVRGLVFLGYPLHPSGKPSDERARHLADVRVPMLFVQGTRDALADMALLTPVIAGLGERARLVTVADADHAFHVPARTGRSDSQVIADVAASVAKWIGAQ